MTPQTGPSDESHDELPAYRKPGFQEEQKRRAEEVAKEHAKAAEKRRKGRELQAALELAGRGNKDERIRKDTSRGEELCITPERWAPLICAAAKLWSEFFDTDVLKDNPIPDTGHGIDAGEFIFRLALSGKDEEVIRAELTLAIERLGPCPTDGRPWNESSIGIASFFSQLAAYFDGVRWTASGRPRVRPESPGHCIPPDSAGSPSQRQPGEHAIATEQSSVPTHAARGAPAPQKLNRFERNIIAALREKQPLTRVKLGTEAGYGSKTIKNRLGWSGLSHFSGMRQAFMKGSARQPA